MTPTAPVADVPRAHLRELAERRHHDPQAVADEVRRHLTATDQGDDTWPLAHWVLGLAQHELGDAAGAVAAFEVAASAAQRSSDAHTEALARASMAISLLSVGDTARALLESAAADALAPPGARGLVELLGALVLQRTGQLDPALDSYDRALQRLRAAGDEPNMTRLLVNRGTLHAYQGRFDRAVADLAEAEDLATRLGLSVLVAMSAHNLGFTLGRRGQVPAALAAFDRAEEAYASRQGPTRLVAALTADRCEVFLGVGLARDAAEAAQRAVALLRDDGDTAYESEARLLLARARLALGDLQAARTEADKAAATFRAAGRGPWEALARYVGLQAAVRATEDTAEPPAAALVSEAQPIAALLAEQGWPVEAMHVRTFLARAALTVGRPDVARSELADIVDARRRGTATLRVEAWHATALLRLAEDDRAGAKRALRRGLSILDAHRASIGATELRSGAAAQGGDLARLGLRLALEDRRAADVVGWAERWRAGALRLPSVTPPDDPTLIAALEELRDARSTLRDATLGGDDAPELTRRVADLEATVRRRTMHTGAATSRPLESFDLRALRERLVGSTLVELLSVDGRLHAVTATAARTRLHDLGPIEQISHEQEHLLAALRRLLRAPAGGGAAESAQRTLAATAARLDDLLLGPLRLPDGPIVVVPTGMLHGLSWSALPTTRGRTVTVTPSAELWQRGPRRAAAADDAQVTLVAGPDLPGADVEVQQLAASYRAATVLRDRSATVAAVSGALEQSDLVHLAAHGRFRADAPMFSSLRLADGLLTVYEIERLRAVPRTLVLPACDAAVVDVRPGDELLGTAAALLGLGVAAVVAPVLPIPDVASTPLMLRLHRHLAAGLAPSAALAAASADDPHDPVPMAFVCIGTDMAGP